MTYIYILSTHDEYGAEDVIATLDRSKIVSLIEAWNSSSWDPNKSLTGGSLTEEQRAESLVRSQKWKNMAIEAVKILLEKPDEELGNGQANNLHRGWGGMQLHVTKVL